MIMSNAVLLAFMCTLFLSLGYLGVPVAFALIAGVLILAVPRLLNIIVALYLIILGLTGLLPHLMR